MKTARVGRQTGRGEAIEGLKVILRAGAAVKKWKKQYKNSRQRVNILKEWISTERSYI